MMQLLLRSLTAPAAALLVAGCSSLWPSLSEAPAEGAMPRQTQLAAAELPPGIRRPYVVIRFDKPDVNYEPALQAAVSKALEREPEIGFDLVAVAPVTQSPTDAARDLRMSGQNSEAVLESLTEMGLPPERVTVSAITSADARGNEVRLYLR